MYTWRPLLFSSLLSGYLTHQYKLGWPPWITDLIILLLWILLLVKMSDENNWIFFVLKGWENMNLIIKALWSAKNGMFHKEINDTLIQGPLKNFTVAVQKMLQPIQNFMVALYKHTSSTQQWNTNLLNTCNKSLKCRFVLCFTPVRWICRMRSRAVPDLLLQVILVHI